MKELIDLSVKDYLAELGAGSAAPGGGSVAALSGALSAALCCMVARLTVGRKKYESAWPEMEQVIANAAAAGEHLQRLVDEDSQAYKKVMESLRLPRATAAETEARRLAVAEATRGAARVPLEVLRLLDGLLPCVKSAVARGNANCLSDARAAARTLQAAAGIAADNVRINLAALDDPDFCAAVGDETIALETRLERGAASLISLLS